MPAKIRRLRHALGLNPEEFAEKACVSQPMLCRWEQGLMEPGTAHLMVLATLAGQTVEAFVTDGPAADGRASRTSER